MIAYRSVGIECSNELELSFAESAALLLDVQSSLAVPAIHMFALHTVELIRLMDLISVTS